MDDNINIEEGKDFFFAGDRAIKSITPVVEDVPKPEPAIKKSAPIVVTKQKETTPTPSKERYAATKKPTLKTYPERTFDQYKSKTVQFTDETLKAFSELELDISWAKKNAQGSSNQRITINTIVRILTDEFMRQCPELQNDDSFDFVQLENEESIRKFIRNKLTSTTLQ